MKHFFELLLSITQKELTARYKNTLFGFLWILINPLMQMIVIGFVFRFFIKEPIENYYYYLLTGLLVWNFFSLSLSKTSPSIVNERNLIKKAKFEREVIPLSIILSNFVNLLIAFVILLIPVLFTRIFSPYILLNFTAGMLFLLIFTAGLSLLTSALNVRFRDISFFIQAILIIWFYATPIVYSMSVIPEKLIWLWRLNPMTSIVQLFQNALTSAKPPDLIMLLCNGFVTVVIVYFGVTVFRKESKHFDDWL